MPTASTWQFLLTSLGGQVIGEITQGTNRQVTLPLNGVPTANFTIPVWHPLASNVLGLDALLKVYRRDSLTGTRTLVFHGPLLSAEEVGTDTTQTIQAAATGPFWRLTKRFIGQSKAGIQFGTDAAMIDLGTIAQTLITTTNGVGFTGIGNGSTTPSTSGVFGPVWLQNVAEAIATLSAGINSFDYEVFPTEPTFPAGSIPQIGVFNAQPLIGVQNPKVVFEYGTSRANITSYDRQRTLQDVVNRGIMSLQGWPDGSGTQDLIVNTDPTSIAARGIFEDVLNDNGVVDDGLRLELVNANLQYRANARERVTFTVAKNARPAPFVDYKVGDWVRARAVVGGSIRFDAMFRIWGITFTIDQNGNEALDLQLVQDG